ncbi:MAG TPA: alpha/beta fold hydrolase [Sporolactobacillaceae bacterium]|nr:alpha/beta fold hydrolase [Sporolactobacillaceae bacterium]
MVNAEGKTKAELNLLKIPSSDAYIIGRMFISEGQGPHPTVVLLHGFPGVMMNLDIASELQFRGWNVLVINYRGSWGSQGDFSFSHALEDVKATLTYIKQSEVAAQNRIDLSRLAVVGHSFGGFLALKTAADDPTIKNVASLSGVNLSLYVQLIKQSPEFEALLRANLQASCYFLTGCSADRLVQDVEDHHLEWNTFQFASALADRHLLITAAVHDEELPKALFNDPLIQSFKDVHAPHLTYHIIDTDHNYVSKRKELADTLHSWLSETLF